MRKLLGVLLIMLLVAAVVPAIDLDPTEGSPTNTTTGGRFQSDFDKFTDVINWSELESNVLFLQFDGPESDSVSQFQGGTGFFLGDLYFGGFLGVAFPRTFADNEERVEDQSEIYIENGQVVAKEEFIEKDVAEVRLQDTEFDFTFGTTVGEMVVGITNRLQRYQNNFMGTAPLDNGRHISGLENGWNDPEDAVNQPQFDDFDGNDPFEVGDYRDQSLFQTVASGNDTTYENNEVFDDEGFVNDQSFSNGTILGAKLPVGPLQLDNYLFFFYSANNQNAEHGLKESETFFDENLPDFRGVQNASSVNETSATYTNSYGYLTPGLYSQAAFQYSDTVELTGGLAYQLSTRIGDPKSWEFSNTDYTATYDGTYVDTDTTDYTVNAEAEISDTLHRIGLPIGVNVTPSDQFRYSVGYEPVFRFGSDETVYSGEIREVRTQTFGDPENPDVVTTEVGTIDGNTESGSFQDLEHRLNLGAQFYLRENFRVNLGTTMSMKTLSKYAVTYDADDDNTYVRTQQTGDGDAVTQEYEIDELYADDLSGQDRDQLTNDVMDGPSQTFELGFTYFFNDEMELDLVYESTNFTFDGRYFEPTRLENDDEGDAQNSSGDIDGDVEDYTVGNIRDTSIWSLGNWALQLTIRY